MRKTTTVRLAMSLILIIFLSGGGGIYAGQKENKELDKYFAMSIQELLNLEIYTAGKTDEKISAVPASVVLVTREE
ncbi:MAG: hypothetical protein GY757_08730, partial [bacterium]|nr:hypothetical protein [bacterium]